MLAGVSKTKKEPKRLAERAKFILGDNQQGWLQPDESNILGLDPPVCLLDSGYSSGEKAGSGKIWAKLGIKDRFSVRRFAGELLFDGQVIDFVGRDADENLWRELIRLMEPPIKEREYFGIEIQADFWPKMEPLQVR
jgi:hypothetical protein